VVISQEQFFPERIKLGKNGQRRTKPWLRDGNTEHVTVHILWILLLCLN